MSMNKRIIINGKNNIPYLIGSIEKEIFRLFNKKTGKSLLYGDELSIWNFFIGNGIRYNMKIWNELDNDFNR